MNCEMIRPELKAYLDRELPLLNRFVVSRHIRSCKECRKEIAEMTAVADVIKSTNQEETLGEELRGCILADVEDSHADPADPDFRAQARKVQRRPWSPIGVGAAITACALLGLAVVFPIFGKARERARQVSPDQKNDLYNPKTKKRLYLLTQHPILTSQVRSATMMRVLHTQTLPPPL